jgi:hypothetical protein
MRLLGAILLLAAVLLVIWGVTRLLEARRAQRAQDAPWTVEVDNGPVQALVLIARPGHEPMVVGSVSVLEEHWAFDEKLTELRLEAETRALAMNRKLG